MLNAGIAGLFTSFLAGIFDEKSKIFQDFYNAPFGTIVGVSILAIFCLFVVIVSCQMIDATFFAMLRTTEIIFGYALQASFSQAMPNSLTVMGGLIVISSCSFIAFEEYFVSKIPWNKVRNIM